MVLGQQNHQSCETEPEKGCNITEQPRGCMDPTFMEFTAGGNDVELPNIWRAVCCTKEGCERERLDIDKVEGGLEVGHLLGGKTPFTVAKGYISILLSAALFLGPKLPIRELPSLIYKHNLCCPLLLTCSFLSALPSAGRWTAAVGCCSQ